MMTDEELDDILNNYPEDEDDLFDMVWFEEAMYEEEHEEEEE